MVESSGRQTPGLIQYYTNTRAPLVLIGGRLRQDRAVLMLPVADVVYQRLLIFYPDRP
jgi:hypothetical protein